MEQAERVARTIGRIIAVAGLALLLALAVATIADGVLRYLFASPIDAVRDIGGMVAAVAVASCIPLLLLERGNITIRLIGTFVGPRAGRIVDIAAALLIELILLGMGWQFARFATQASVGGSATWMLHVPIAPFWWVVDGVFWVAVAMQGLVTIQYFAGASLGATAEH